MNYAEMIAEYGLQFSATQSIKALNGTTADLILAGDPMRWAFMISIAGSGSASWGLSSTMNSQQGFNINNTNQIPSIITQETMPGLAQQPIYAIGMPGIFVITIAVKVIPANLGKYQSPQTGLNRLRNKGIIDKANQRVGAVATPEESMAAIVSPIIPSPSPALNPIRIPPNAELNPLSPKVRTIRLAGDLYNWSGSNPPGGFQSRSSFNSSADWWRYISGLLETGILIGGNPDSADGSTFHP